MMINKVIAVVTLSIVMQTNYGMDLRAPMKEYEALLAHDEDEYARYELKREQLQKISEALSTLAPVCSCGWKRHEENDEEVFKHHASHYAVEDSCEEGTIDSFERLFEELGIGQQGTRECFEGARSFYESCLRRNIEKQEHRKRSLKTLTERLKTVLKDCALHKED
jgi:hypothetical protein